MFDLAAIAAHCDKHEKSGRAVFSVAGIRELLALVNRTGPTDEQFRAMGYTGAARQYPIDDPLTLTMFAAFNGVSVDQLPATFRYHPNAWNGDAWARVAKAAGEFIIEERARTLYERWLEWDDVRADRELNGDHPSWENANVDRKNFWRRMAAP